MLRYDGELMQSKVVVGLSILVMYRINSNVVWLAVSCLTPLFTISPQVQSCVHPTYN